MAKNGVCMHATVTSTTPFPKQLIAVQLITETYPYIIYREHMPPLWTLRCCGRWLKPLQCVCNLNAQPALVVKKLASRVQYQTCTHRESSKFCSVSFKVWPNIYRLGQSLKEIDFCLQQSRYLGCPMSNSGLLRLIIRNVRRKCNMIRQRNTEEKD